MIKNKEYYEDIDWNRGIGPGPPPPAPLPYILTLPNIKYPSKLLLYIHYIDILKVFLSQYKQWIQSVDKIGWLCWLLRPRVSKLKCKILVSRSFFWNICIWIQRIFSFLLTWRRSSVASKHRLVSSTFHTKVHGTPVLGNCIWKSGYNDQ